MNIKNTCKYVVLLLAVFMLLPLQVVVQAEDYGFTGSGMKVDPYLIESIEDLCRMREYVNRGISYAGVYFAQTTDLVFDGKENWDPIGSVDEGTVFSGVYDGRGHTISNIQCEDRNAGVFSYLDGEVRNLGIESGTFEGICVGSITSHGTGNARIFNCYNKATVIGAGRAGGIADNMNGGTVEFCWNLGDVVSDTGVTGGIISYLASSLKNCYALDMPPTSEHYTGETVDSESISKSEITDEWMDRFNLSLYLYTAGSSDGEFEETFYVKASENTVSFLGEDFIPSVVQKEIDELEEQAYSFSGSGVREDPFLIESLEDFRLLRNCVDKGVSYAGFYFAQTVDLCFPDGENWDPIGSVDEGAVFSGVYDGRGHTISNIQCEDRNAGVFSYLDGEVRNLGIESGTFEGVCVGSITSHGTGNARIFNCYNKATVIGAGRAGGIADNMNGGTVEFCWNLGDVVSDTGVTGGIISYLASSLKNCYVLDMPPTSEHYTGEIVDSESISKSEITDEWMDRFNLSLYKHATEVLEEDGERVCYLKAGDNAVLFAQQDAIPTIVEREISIQFLVQYGTLILLSVLALVFLGIGGIQFSVFRRNKQEEKAVEETQPPKSIGIKKPCVAGIALVSAFVVFGTFIVNRVLYLKRDDGVLTMQNFYMQPENTVDVVFLGSSKAGVNLDGEVLWRDYGISSYALWGSVQPLWNSYYFLQEAIRENTPQVVVLDVNIAARDFQYSDDGRQYTNTYGMKLSANKLEAIRVSAPQERWKELLFGMPIYHNRYLELSKEDFMYCPWTDHAFRVIYKGFSVRYGTAGLTGMQNGAEIQTVESIGYKQEVYLRKIIDLCGEQGIPIVLVATPSFDVKSIQPYLNYVQLIAQEYGVDFINYNLLVNQLQFSEDMFVDTGHVNTEGGRILSDHLGAYLKENYELTDHRGDADYESWEAFAHQQQNTYQTKITDQEDYIEELGRNDRTVVLVKWGDLKGLNVNGLTEKMEAVGMETEFLNKDGNVCCVIDSTHDMDAAAYYTVENGLQIRIDGKPFAVNSSGKRRIQYAGEELSTFTSGVFCMVYDTYTGEVVDSRMLLGK